MQVPAGFELCDVEDAADCFWILHEGELAVQSITGQVSPLLSSHLRHAPWCEGKPKTAAESGRGGSACPFQGTCMQPAGKVECGAEACWD